MRVEKQCESFLEVISDASVSVCGVLSPAPYVTGRAVTVDTVECVGCCKTSTL